MKRKKPVFKYVKHGEHFHLLRDGLIVADSNDEASMKTMVEYSERLSEHMIQRNYWSDLMREIGLCVFAYLIIFTTANGALLIYKHFNP
jgi:hypothetical protein